MEVKKFELFLICERLHINKEMDEYSDKIYNTIIYSKNKSKFEFTDLPNNLNIVKLIINLRDDMEPGLSGQLDINRCKKTRKGWIIYIELTRTFMLYVLKHELNHALRLTLLGKDKMIKNVNYVKSQSIFNFSKDKEMEYFFYLMYLANDEEINAKVMETNGLIREIMDSMGLSKLTKEEFNFIIGKSTALQQCNLLIDFKCDNLFKNYDDNKLNMLFYTLEQNKMELDKIQDSKFSKLKLVIKAFKDILGNKTGFILNNNNIYNPKRGKKFYDRWIPSQGEKLRKRIYSLYDHYI